jgi:V/A-type H+-transporting ATPase subunit I
VAVGAAHIVLGLGIGAWQAIRLNTLRVLVEKVGMLLALAGLFGVVAVAAGRLSSTAMAPALAAVVAGLALIMSLNGVLGIATGALDLLAKLGNILSYLRLAAVGLASAHLANVANQLGTLGPVWLGIVIAIFLHALNLALASFSPLIQSLRLHYVEFFGAFLIGGGRAFQPFGSTSEREALATQ